MKVITSDKSAEKKAIKPTLKRTTKSTSERHTQLCLADQLAISSTITFNTVRGGCYRSLPVEGGGCHNNISNMRTRYLPGKEQRHIQ